MNHILRTNVPIGAAVALLLATWAMEAELASAETCGFVSAEKPYNGGQLVTRAQTFTGSRLVLNLDTGAAGDAQVGLLDKEVQPLEGYGLDDRIYSNGDFLEREVEWLDKGKDVSALAGQPVQLVFRMRGAKLYTLQFVDRSMRLMLSIRWLHFSEFQLV